MLLWTAEPKGWELFSAVVLPAATLLKYINPAVTDIVLPVRDKRLTIGFLND